MLRPSRRRDSAFAGSSHVVNHYTRKEDDAEDENEGEDEDGDEHEHVNADGDDHSTAATLVTSRTYSIA
jgi:hypothetical protein